MDEWKKHSQNDIGWGGYKCECCGIEVKDKKAHRRRVRARMKSALRKEMRKLLDDE